MTQPYRTLAPSSALRERGYLMMVSPSLFHHNCILYGPYRWRWLTRWRARLQVFGNPNQAVVVYSVHEFLYELLPLQTERVKRSFHRYAHTDEHGVFGTISVRL